MVQYHFSVLITQDEAGMYTAKVPELPGCHTQARTLPDLHERIEEAISLYVEVQNMKQHTVPQEKFVGVQQVEISM